MNKLNVVGLHEIAHLFDIESSSASRWRKEGTLPEADAVLGMGPVWRRATIVAWANQTGRTINNG